jgi:small-conductance mechanosensitive channel
MQEIKNNPESQTNSDNSNSTIKEAPKPFIEQINDYSSYPYLNALGAILVFLMLGKLVDWIITGVLKTLVVKTKSDFDDKVLLLLHRPIFLSVLLFGFGFATYLLDQPVRITGITIHILQTIAVIVWFRFGLQIIQISLDEMENNEQRFKFVTPTTKPLIKNTLSIILVALNVYVIFLIWNINITAWIASAGIIGLAVSFAAKDTLANVFGGVTIFADKPFKVGDFINLDGGERGVITQIGVRSTRILTRDDIEITVPNGVLANTMVINESGGPHEKFRIRLKVGVAYGSDIDLVEKVLMSVASGHQEICKNPEPRVRFRLFGSSSLDYELLCWVERPVLRGRILHELNRNVYKAFQAENIEIPFPQQDIYIKEIPGGRIKN